MIEVLIGNISSGKTSYARHRALQSALIIDESFIFSLHAGLRQMVTKNNNLLYRNLEYQIISFALSNNKDVIIDKCNFSSLLRERYIRIAKGFDTDIVGIVFPRENPNIHSERKIKYNKEGYDEAYWKKVAELINKKYESPSLAEGFNCIMCAKDVCNNYLNKC